MIRADALLARFRALPVAPPETGTFALISPHPDDESLGCGGLIAQACAAGRPPILIMLTDGAASHPGSAAYPPATLARVRQAETDSAAAALGLPPGRVYRLNVPDGAAPAQGEAAAQLAGRVAALAAGCSAILTTWRHDPHPDHQAAWAIGREAAGALGVPLWEYPVWGWTLPPGALLPDAAWAGHRVDISLHLAAKQRAVAAHASQHGRVVMDAPDGFVLPAAFLARFDGPFETLVRTA